MSENEMVSGVDSSARDEVVTLVRDLIGIDTSNFGDDSGPGEALAAEFVEDRLMEMGFETERFSTTSSRRQGVAVRVPGHDRSRPALVVHTHLDTVPAVADDWTVPPWSGEVVDDMVWGRGAVDMKDFVGISLALLRSWARLGVRPDRDVIALYLPDEEAGGQHGGHWVVDNRRDLIEGATEAIGEVGGFSISVNDDLRLYTVQTAEKGIEWMRLRAVGRAGHGSMINDDNAVTALCEAVARVGRLHHPLVITRTVQAFLDSLSEHWGVTLDPAEPEQVLATLGPLARFIGATLHDTANPTMLSSGYKANVIPETAEACIDGRYLPGQREEFLARIDAALGPDIVRESVTSDIAYETTFDGALVDLMAQVVREVDPGSHTIPYMLSGGTDAKSLSTAGLRCFGFMPLRLPPDLDFAALFHGVDERVPVESLRFGLDALDRFLRRA